MFIILEGCEATGKTSQVKALKSYFSNLGRDVMTVNCPGTTPDGLKMREILLNREEPLSSPAEMLLFLASIFDTFTQCIVPALESNKVVICDRFTDTTAVHQMFIKRDSFHLFDTLLYVIFRTIPEEHVKYFEKAFVITLGCDVDILMKRTRQRGNENVYDRMKQEFHTKAALGFKLRASNGHQMIPPSQRGIVEFGEDDSIESVTRLILSKLETLGAI